MKGYLHNYSAAWISHLLISLERWGAPAPGAPPPIPTPLDYFFVNQVRTKITHYSLAEITNKQAEMYVHSLYLREATQSIPLP